MGKLTRKYGLELNSVTVTAIIASRAWLLDLKRGKGMLREMVGKGFVFFVGSALVDMYVTCGCLEMAKVVSEQLLRKTVVAWNYLTAGFRTGKGNREVAYREGSNDPYIYSYCFIKNLSSARNWGRVRLKMKETGLKKNPLVVAGMRLTAESNHSS
ncbi:hypothetical protein H0E87_005928 [Populus deltoides]|uniref:Pentatricopeptide repeat-containing protein n=1 Tax=Populus deltoides TaxID=3696 RepID=A0A8T2Z5A7_POPDE|nr:hypothetical protein H0E87_005928 [Populus deltoides]